MFLPSAHKREIERRSVQHLLLMLLRMVLLLLLALAFARPSQMYLAATPSPAGAGAHMILLDTSYSMGHGEQFTSAQARALQVLDSFPAKDRVGFLSFHRTVVRQEPIDRDGETISANRQRIRAAIENTVLTQEATAYGPALQQAQSHLLAHAETSESARLGIHLLSDLQKSGLPVSGQAWKLSSRIELVPIAIPAPDSGNASLLDTALIMQKSQELRVLSQVKNSHPTQAWETTLTLSSNGEPIETQSLNVPPGRSVNVAFTHLLPANTAHTGIVELGPDALAADNRFYFCWNPEQPKRIALLGSSSAPDPHDASWFLSRALSSPHNKEWQVQYTQFSQGPTALAANPDLLILADAAGLADPILPPLAPFLRQGRAALLILNPQTPLSPACLRLLQEWGIQPTTEPRTERQNTAQERLSWLDFAHPLLAPFQDAQFNDFSTLRFFKYHPLSTTNTNESLAVLARFDSGIPALLHASLGQGRVVIWNFSPDPTGSNLIRSPKFVALLYESLRYLAGPAPEIRTWRLGESLQPPAIASTDPWQIRLPQEASPQPYRQDTATQPGWIEWHNPGIPQLVWQEAINVDPKEADPAVLTAEAFQRVFTQAAPAPSTTPSHAADPRLHRRELGRYVLFGLAIFFLGEMLYVNTLARQRATRPIQKGAGS
jgi:hypothetical protein